MKKIFFKFAIVSIATTALAAMSSAQTPFTGSSTSPGTSRGYLNSESSRSQSYGSSSNLNSLGSSSSNSWSSGQLSATGRSSQQTVRGTKVIGCDVTGTSGDKIGTIEDLILNPSSGKVEFAVISRNGEGASSSPSGTGSGASGSSLSPSQGNPTPVGRSNGHSQNTGSGMGAMNSQSESSSSSLGLSSTSGDQLIPVPWQLLQPTSSSSGVASSSTSSSGEIQSFILKVNQSKLDQAPTLNSSTWSEITQPGWSQRVNSFFGVSGSSSIGGAESPAGSSSGSNSGSDLNQNH